MPDTAQECIAIIAKQKNIAAGAISAGSTFEELGMDSLDRATVCFEIEERYNVEIPESQLYQVRTVADMVRGVHEALTGGTLEGTAR